MQKLLFILLLIALTVACGDERVKESNEIPVGFYGPMSGNMAFFGNNVLRGIQLGLEEVNRTGVHGKRFRLYIEDNRGNPEEAQTAVSRLITRDKVVAILGDPSSSSSLAGAPVCQQHRIPMITPTATNIKVTQAGDYIFRVCWIDPFQGEIMARFAVQDLKARKLAVLFDVASDYSTGLKEIFKGTAEKMGATVDVLESFSAGDTNFSAQLTNIIQANPDALYIPAYYNETGLIVRQLRGLGSKVLILGGDGWDSPNLLEIGGDALNGSYYCTHFLPSDPDPMVQQFVQQFRRRHAGHPSMGDALGYDSVLLLADAMKRSSVQDSTMIRDAIAATRDFKGVTGTITIDENRNARKPAMIVKIEKGTPVLYKKLQP